MSDVRREVELALTPTWRAAVTRKPALLTALVEGLLAARQHWPEVRASLSTVLDTLLGADPNIDPLPRLTAGRLTDLLLATACAHGDLPALAAFDNYCLRDVPAYLSRMRPTPDELDETRQQVRTHLLVAEPPKPSRIATYAGDGDLRAWVRVIAVRSLIDRRRRNNPAQAGRQDLGELASTADTALAHLKSSYREHFRTAFAEATKQLSEQQRNVLRFQLVDGLTLAEIGALHGVHEATASRWAAAARADLRANTRAQMATILALAEDDVDSALRLIDSHLDASVSRLLGVDS